MAALFAILFFLAGILVKGLISAFNALFDAAGMVLGIGGLTLMTVLALALVYEIFEAIANGRIGQIIGMIVLIIIEVSFVGALFGGLGILLLNIVVKVIGYVLTAIFFALEKVAFICEKGYAKCLLTIMRRVEKY